MQLRFFGGMCASSACASVAASPMLYRRAGRAGDLLAACCAASAAAAAAAFWRRRWAPLPGSPSLSWAASPSAGLPVSLPVSAAAAIASRSNLKFCLSTPVMAPSDRDASSGPTSSDACGSVPNKSPIRRHSLIHQMLSSHPLVKHSESEVSLHVFIDCHHLPVNHVAYLIRPHQSKLCKA